MGTVILTIVPTAATDMMWNVWRYQETVINRKNRWELLEPVEADGEAAAMKVARELYGAPNEIGRLRVKPRPPDLETDEIVI